MAHNLDINAGQASFVTAREDAWHQLGTTLPDAFTAEEAMNHGLLGGWDVRKLPLEVPLEDGTLIPAPGHYATVRNNPVIYGQVDVLGLVGESYTVLQNEDLAGLLDALVHESGAHFETAGALMGGKRVFITMKLPGHIKVGGVDRIDNYLAAVTSHDGSMATTLMVTPIRIVCQNTMNLAFGNHATSFRVRHTRGSKMVLAEAHQALDFTFDYLDNFQEEANQLINTEMSQSEFEKIVTREFGAPEDAPTSTQTRSENRIDEMVQLFADSNTHEGVRNTAWAGLNALTEWYDHFSDVRGENASRARNSLFQTSFKSRAHRLILSNA